MTHAWCVWITGLPGSGKSVVSRRFIEILNEKNIFAQLLSSDDLRTVLTPVPRYSLEERDKVYSVLTFIASLLNKNNINVVIDATANLRRYRDAARVQIPCFIEVYLDCPLNECLKRETRRKETFNAPSKIYLSALEGKAQNVPGIGQPYEAPINPELAINTLHNNIETTAQKIFTYINKLHFNCKK